MARHHIQIVSELERLNESSGHFLVSGKNIYTPNNLRHNNGEDTYFRQ